MVIGVPRESRPQEKRVGLTPSAVGHLIASSHEVVVERDAGIGAHFTDLDFERAGALIVYDREEAYRRADVVCRVGPVPSDEIALLRRRSTVCAFHSLAVAPRNDVRRLMELETTLVGYEIIRDEERELPVLEPLSEMAGQLSIHVAARLLQSDIGGRGTLLGTVPGVPPPTVLVLGGGSVGGSAARMALATGAHVIVIDRDVRVLRRLTRELGGRLVTAIPGESRLARFVAIADVVVGAVLEPGARAPFLVSEEMVTGMKPGSVVIDVSIDQGGCFETSRPTTLDDPWYVVDGVVHYCVPNMTANLARTASRALTNSCLPYVVRLADDGVAEACRRDPGLASGIYLYRGQVVAAGAAETLGMAFEPLEGLLGEGSGGALAR